MRGGRGVASHSDEVLSCLDCYVIIFLVFASPVQLIWRCSTILLQLKLTDRASQAQSGVKMITNPFYHPSPSKIMGHIACFNSMEAKHPPFQARRVGVRILDMLDPGQHPNPLSQVDGPVSHLQFAGRQSEGTLYAAIAAEDGIRGQGRFQDAYKKISGIPGRVGEGG